MSTRNLSQRFDMPANPVFLDFPRTDADTSGSAWPLNTTEVVDRQGNVNFYLRIPEDIGSSLKWKHLIGMKVAEKLGMAGGSNYVFRTWPAGYAFFDHHKGNKENPRHDAYLIGSKLVNRFRSVPEFLPHAIWLMSDPTMDRSNCECKYCTKAPQRMISQKFGFAAPGASPSPSTALPGRPKRPRITRDRVQPYAYVQKIKKPIRHYSPPRQVAVHDRYADIEALITPLGPERDIRRFYREAELIWCALSPPIRSAEGQFIHFWPGVVKSFSTKVETMPREDYEDGSPPAAPVPDKSVDVHSHYYVNDESPSYRIVQRTLYRVQLLCVAHDYFVRDDECLPYPAYSPSADVLHAMRSVRVDPATLDRDELAAFNPCPSDAHTWDSERVHAHFLAAVTPYSHALQAATTLAAFWTPTDEFVYEVFTPAPSTSASTPTPTPASTQDESVERALRTIRSTVVGAQPVPGRPFKQERYQGLWWGTERIWLDELVRLKPARKQIAPSGADHILPPSGPSSATLEAFGLGPDASEQERRDIGAGQRGVFMRLTSLFPVETVGEDGESRVDVLASGVLYELADEGWEEPTSSSSTAPPAPPIPSTPKRSRAHSSEPARSPSKMSTGAPFMSPPGPPPTGALPNPDLAASVSETASAPPNSLDSSAAASTATFHASASTADTATPRPSQLSSGGATDSQVSGPPHERALPPAPPGFKFRPILTPGYEVVVSLTLVSGRYYPGLLRHPLLLPLHAQMREAAERDDHVPQECESVLALEGMRAGFSNTMDPHRWESMRSVMVRNAEEDSWGELVQVWEKAAAATGDAAPKQEDEDVEMDGDGSRAPPSSQPPPPPPPPSSSLSASQPLTQTEQQDEPMDHN